MKRLLLVLPLLTLGCGDLNLPWVSQSSVVQPAAVTSACTIGGNQVWANNIGGPAVSDNAKVFGTAVDNDGNIAVAGIFTGTINLGNFSPMTSTDDVDIFLGKYASSGALLWAKHFGAASKDFFANQVGGVAFDSSGNVYMIGGFYTTIDFGGGPLTASSGNDTFVVKFDPAGTFVWHKNFTSFDGDVGLGITIDPFGNVLITGMLSGWVNFGGGNLTSAGSADIYVAELTSAGVYTWAFLYGDSNAQWPKSIDTDTAGNVLVAGYFKGTLNFGCGDMTSVTNPVSGVSNDGYVVKFSPAGSCLWSKQIGEAEGLEQQSYSVAVDASNNVLVTGYFSGTMNLCGSSVARIGIQDIFLAKYDSAGTCQWAKRFGAPVNVDYLQFGTGVDADADGDVFLTGYIKGPVNFGGGALPTNDPSYISDTFVAEFSPAGTHMLSKRYGNTQNQNGRFIVAYGNDLIASGDFIGTVDFGNGPLVTPGNVNPHVYLTKIAAYQTNPVLVVISDADPSLNGYAAVPAGPQYQNIDEWPQNGDTDYLKVYFNSSGAYGICVNSIPDSMSIGSVKIIWTVKNGSVDDTIEKVGFRIGGTDYWAADHYIYGGTGYQTITDTITAAQLGGTLTKSVLSTAWLRHFPVSQEGLPRPQLTQLMAKVYP